jgi:NAD-dependent SIR2 family protein deacetylase
LIDLARAHGNAERALRNGARILEVNPQETPYSSRMHWSIRGKCGEVLPQLFHAAFAKAD